MNRNLFFSVFAVMLTALFALVSSGGCGGSNNLASINTQIPDTPDTQTDPDIPAVIESIVGSEIILALDINGNNKPDVFDFDKVQQLHSSTSGTELHAAIPFMFWMEALPDQNSPDIINVELTAGTDYTFELSRNLAESLGRRIPDIEIFDTSGHKINNAVLTVYPEAQPSMLLYTFTPSVSGTYTAKICNADGNSEGDTDCVLFVYRELHNSKGENGYYARFIIAKEDGSITAEASVSELIQLRKNFLKAYPEYLKKVYGENPESVDDITQNLEDYYAWMSILNAHAGISVLTSEDEEEALSEAAYTDEMNAAAIGVTQIDSWVTNVPYVTDYKLGTGLMATTNLQPFSMTALEPFTLKVPSSDVRTGSRKFNYSFISSKEDYEQKMGRNFKMGLTTDALGINSSVQSAGNLKFGLTSTTIVIHYEEMESEYRELPIDQYKLTKNAAALLDRDRESFREEYGDYFVAGYQYGGMYEAHIAITTDTTEQLDSVKTLLGASLGDMETALTADTTLGDTSIGVQFSKESQEILKKNNAQISVEIKTIGAGKTEPITIPLTNSSDISAMNNVVQELAKFRNAMGSNFSANTYVPVNVEFYRYRSIPDLRDKIDKYIPVPAMHSANIMSFNSELLALRGYHNTINSIPDNKMDRLSRDEYARQFNAIVNPIKAAGNAFYDKENEKGLADTLPKVIELSRKLKIAGDRLTFYRSLVSAQEKENRLGQTLLITKRPFGGTNGGSTGYKSFDLSTAVNGDIAKGTASTDVFIGGTRFIANVWRPSYDAGKDYRYSWFQVTATSQEDSNRDVENPPAAGKQKAVFYFRGKAFYSSYWKVESQSAYMPRSLYPFFGLSD